MSACVSQDLGATLWGSGRRVRYEQFSKPPPAVLSEGTFWVSLLDTEVCPQWVEKSAQIPQAHSVEAKLELNEEMHEETVRCYSSFTEFSMVCSNTQDVLANNALYSVYLWSVRNLKSHVSHCFYENWLLNILQNCIFKTSCSSTDLAGSEQFSSQFSWLSCLGRDYIAVTWLELWL